MAKGNMLRAVMRMRHSPAGKRHLKQKKTTKKKETEPTYFRGGAFERPTIESRLREAGIDPARFKKKKK